MTLLRLGSLGICCLLSLFSPARLPAIDGAIDVSQVRAQRGGVTPVDGPGFPVTLGHSGLYRLTGNLDLRNEASPENVVAIEVAASDVTVDLNGFEIIGATTCTIPNEPGPATCTPIGTGAGVVAGAGDPPFENIVVRNGSIRGMGAVAVGLPRGSVEGVRARDSGLRGINVGAGTVSDCVVNAAQMIGINVGTGVIRRSTAAHAGTGIYLGAGSARDCVAEANNLGLSAGASGAIEGCSVSGNLEGITVEGAFAIRGNTVVDNGSGITCGDGSTVVGNTVRLNDGFGISFSGRGGYAQNVLTLNNSGVETQVSGGTQIGTNYCGTNTTCP